MEKNTKPIVSAIVAMSENRVIGANNTLPWHLPADLAHFKKITMGKPLVLGRKTYESIGRPLPGRTMIILSRKNMTIENCHVFQTFSDVSAWAQKENVQELMIGGGAEIYKLLMPEISCLYLTLVHATIAGDTFFPEIDLSAWKLVSREDHDKDEKNEYAFSFLKYCR